VFGVLPGDLVAEQMLAMDRTSSFTIRNTVIRYVLSETVYFEITIKNIVIRCVLSEAVHLESLLDQILTTI
jgi:hypothetical protein